MISFLKQVFTTIVLIALAGPANAESIKVLTYNTWGVPFTAWDTWRYDSAMQTINHLDPDVVVLTEVFTPKGRSQFKSKRFPYRVDGPRLGGRLVGSGLRVLSKFPILNYATLKYRACKGSDCFSRKGAALVTVALSNNKKVNVVATHLDASDRNARLSQLKQLHRFTEWFEDESSPTIIAGDMNFGPKSSEYQFTLSQLMVDDGWVKTHGAEDPGYTYDCENNHYAREYSKRTGEPMIRKRLDYLFHKGAIFPIQTELQLNREENLFSDHFGLMGTYEL
jgi:endonuclease/exonuclease/phosphatase family metal-dependent hydrolase